MVRFEICCWFLLKVRQTCSHSFHPEFKKTFTSFSGPSRVTTTTAFGEKLRAVWMNHFRRFCLTFIPEYSNSDGEQSTQHVQESYGSLQRPFILTLSALGSFLDPCRQIERTTRIILCLNQTCLVEFGGRLRAPVVPHLDKHTFKETSSSLRNWGWRRGKGTRKQPTCLHSMTCLFYRTHSAESRFFIFGAASAVVQS